MNIKFCSMLVLTIAIIFSGCSRGQVPELTLTPLPTNTPIPSSTATAIPTPTSTPVPISFTYNPVPRWMILNQPFYNVEIFGEKWNYTNDRWGDTYACIDYTREKEPYLFFEECFAFTQPNLTFESQRDAFVNDNFEVLVPNNTFGDVGQTSLVAKRLEDNSTKFIKFFELIGVDTYILLVEMNMATDDTAPLQTIYERQAAETINYALQNMLEKSHLIPRPTATPLSSNQQAFHRDLASILITEEEASEIYTATWVGEKEGSIDGTWESLGDYVNPDAPMVCRYFEDRTNVDVLWTWFSNCVYFLSDPAFTFEGFIESKKKPSNIFLDSRHQYQDKFFLYGQLDGKTYFVAYMMHGEYLYSVRLESRTIGEATLKFTDTVDDFIYNVFMLNAKK